MTSPKPPTLLTEEELAAIEDDALMPVREMGLPCEMSGADAERLLAMARLSLALQRRVEELEARLGVVERACIAGLFNGLDAISCEVLLTVSNGARALPATAKREHPMSLAGWVQEKRT